ncbi:hypothetical protein FRC07_013619 [Ceratobasidium sp. 392]|nr:hypothetical protein FRC07_013619 [Ceratobasidium sp. 392]
MPLQPLAKILLLFLADKAVELGDSVYDVRPWTNSRFRLLAGLKSLRGEESVQPDGTADECDQYIDPADGFILTDEATKSIKEKDKKYFTAEARQKITHFLTDVQKHAVQLRTGEPGSGDGTSKKKKKRKAKKSKADPLSDNSDEETFVDRVENIPGFKEFRGASLAMLNRGDGVIDEVFRIMTDMGRTPMIAWKNFVYTSQTLPSRASQQLPEEKLQERRQEEIDSRKRELNNHDPPAIGKYLDSRLVNRVANALFGADAFKPNSDILWDCYDKVVTSLIRRTWERERRRARYTLKRSAAKKEEYGKALQAARDNPCPRLMRKASQELKQCKELAEITGELGEPSFVAKLKALEDLWGDLGYSEDLMDDETAPRPKRRKLLPLATKERMDAAYVEYRERHFSDMDDAMLEMTEALGSFGGIGSSDSDDADGVVVDLLETLENKDLGVDAFADSPLAELLRLLGIERAGTLPMASEELETKWHQLVGIAAILERMFTPSLGDAPLPSLLCDEKT